MSFSHTGEAALALRPQVKIIAASLNSRRPPALAFDDLLSVGFLGAMQAATRFDASHGCTLATSAEGRIRGAMLDEIRKEVGRTDRPSGRCFQVPLKNAVAVPWRGPSPFDVCEQDAMKALLLRLVNKLPARERTMLRLSFWAGMTHQEIAGVFGVDASRVSQLKAKSLSRLRAALARRRLTEFSDVATNCMN